MKLWRKVKILRFVLSLSSGMMVGNGKDLEITEIRGNDVIGG